MKTNKEKFLDLPFVEREQNDTLQKIKDRIKNRALLRESQSIALKVLVRLDELSWSQKRLAEEMGVSPQQVNKITSGKENLTTATQVKLQDILNIPILASYYEKSQKEIIAKSIPSVTMKIELQSIFSSINESPFCFSEAIAMQCDKNANEYSYDTTEFAA